MLFTSKKNNLSYAIQDVEIIHNAAGNVMVIVTELDENMGQSVTNQWPELAFQICDHFHLKMDTVTWVEHYIHHWQKWHNEGENHSWDLVKIQNMSVDWERLPNDPRSTFQHPST